MASVCYARCGPIPCLREIPIILLSARAGEESRIEGMEAGADDYLVKPFSARELVARVETHVKSVAHAAGSEGGAPRERRSLPDFRQHGSGDFMDHGVGRRRALSYRKAGSITPVKAKKRRWASAGLTPYIRKTATRPSASSMKRPAGASDFRWTSGFAGPTANTVGP